LVELHPTLWRLKFSIVIIFRPASLQDPDICMRDLHHALWEPGRKEEPALAPVGREKMVLGAALGVLVVLPNSTKR
jgi:hypothetical protein